MLADEVEAALGLANLQLDAEQTRRHRHLPFRGARLLEEAARLLAAGKHERRSSWLKDGSDSHWVRTNPRRLAQWSAAQQAAVLGSASLHAPRRSAAQGEAARAWVERYTAADGWHEVDSLDRRLGAFLSAMDEEPVAAQAIGQMQQEYAEWVRALTEGFVPALDKAQWDTGWELHQTQVFDDRVKPAEGPVAFFVVDAFRYEMAQELADRLDQADRVSLEAAVAALPTITPVGMAALLPGASASFSVRETGTASQAPSKARCSPTGPRAGNTSRPRCRRPSSCGWSSCFTCPRTPSPSALPVPASCWSAPRTSMPSGRQAWASSPSRPWPRSSRTSPGPSIA